MSADHAAVIIVALVVAAVWLAVSNTYWRVQTVRFRKLAELRRNLLDEYLDDKEDPMPRYVLKTKGIEARQVNEDNIVDVADWSGGEVVEAGSPFVLVNKGERAFLGDFVAKKGSEFHAVSARTFEALFAHPLK